MFFHNLKYSLKCLFKNKGLIFWTFVFPIILGTFYKLAFSNIESAEKLDTVDIAVIESETSKIYTEVLNNIGMDWYVRAPLALEKHVVDKIVDNIDDLF